MNPLTNYLMWLVLSLFTGLMLILKARHNNNYIRYWDSDDWFAWCMMSIIFPIGILYIISELFKITVYINWKGTKQSLTKERKYHSICPIITLILLILSCAIYIIVLVVMIYLNT